MGRNRLRAELYPVHRSFHRNPVSDPAGHDPVRQLADGSGRLRLPQYHPVVVGSYIEPRVSGSILSISPLVVLFAVFFWTFLWGLFGTFIGVPIALAILSFSRQHPSSRWLADLLGGPEQTKTRKI